MAWKPRVSHSRRVSRDTQHTAPWHDIPLLVTSFPCPLPFPSPLPSAPTYVPSSVFVVPCLSSFYPSLSLSLSLSRSLFVLHGRFCRSTRGEGGFSASDARRATLARQYVSIASSDTWICLRSWVTFPFYVDNSKLIPLIGFSVCSVYVYAATSLYTVRVVHSRQGYTRSHACTCIHAHVRVRAACVFGIVDYIIRARCANGNEAHCSLKITNNRCSTVSTTRFINIYKSSAVPMSARERRIQPDSA